MLLVDGVIESGADNADPFDMANGNGVYMHNVYTTGISAIEGMTIDPVGWTLIRELSKPDTSYQCYIDGTVDNTAFVDQQHGVAAPPTDKLIELHRIHDLDAPYFEMGDVVFAKRDGGAKGDEYTDDYAVLQGLIDNHQKVFVEKGKYRITNTLTLRSTTKLFGMGSCATIIAPSNDWRPDVNQEAFVLQTVDDANATTHLAHIAIGAAATD